MRQVIGGKALLSNKCLYFCAFLVGMIDRVKRRMYPEFCKGLCKKCPENRMNSGVQGISEMYKTVVFFLVF